MILFGIELLIIMVVPECLKMDGNIKEQLVKSVDVIKNKLKQIKDEDDKLQLEQQKKYKPIINPLRDIAYNGKLKENKSTYIACDNEETNNNNTPNIGEDNSYNTMAKFFIPSPIKQTNVLDDEEMVNVPFGIRCENNQLMVGNTPAVLSTDSNSITFIEIGDRSYELTSGLKELLFKKNPMKNLASESDKLVYKDILLATNVHKRDYHPEGQVKGDKGKKYTQIIKPLLLLDVKSSESKSGGNLTPIKKYKKNTDFIFWDDPNELVDRLKLLTASKDAGNTNHDNEIISIIEELKEAGIIKE